MGRSKGSGTLADLFAIASALPYWVGIILALISYIFLHSYAIAEISPSEYGTGGMVISTLIKSFSSILQYLIPFVFLLGSGASFISNRANKQLFNFVEKSPHIDSLNVMSWQDFEHFTGEYFRNKGYKVSETANGADGGIDLFLFKNNEKFYVQCKHWRSQKVSVSVVRELYGVMAANAVKRGFVVTTGRYTSEAMTFAQGTNIRLIDGNELVNQMKHCKSPVQEQKTIKNEQTLCPKCNGLMVKRIAKRGQYAGNTFLGCQNYPRCRGVINID